MLLSVEGHWLQQSHVQHQSLTFSSISSLGLIQLCSEERAKRFIKKPPAFPFNLTQFSPLTQMCLRIFLSSCVKHSACWIKRGNLKHTSIKTELFTELLLSPNYPSFICEGVTSAVWRVGALYYTVVMDSYYSFKDFKCINKKHKNDIFIHGCSWFSLKGCVKYGRLMQFVFYEIINVIY